MKLIATTIPVADTEWGHGHMAEWGAGGWVAMIAFWALVIVAIVWIARELAGSRLDGSSSAMQVLERRLAAGEIGVEEYRQRKAALEDDSGRISPTEKQD